MEAIPFTPTARRILGGELVVRTPDGRIDRSRSLVRVAHVLHGAGVPPVQIAETLAERDIALGWRKYADRADVHRQYAQLVALVCI
jgi:hypothetical protein